MILVKCFAPVRYHEGECMKGIVEKEAWCRCDNFKLTYPRSPLLLSAEEYCLGHHSRAYLAVYQGRHVLIAVDKQENLWDYVEIWSTE